MPSVQKKTVQLRLSAALYSKARQAVDEIDEVSSFNDFAVSAIQESLKRLEEAKIDAAFSRMGKDEKYLRVTADVSRDFSDNDGETLGISGRK
jgi:hypothetical protein